MKFLSRHQRIGILLLWMSCIVNAFGSQVNKSTQEASMSLNPKQEAILKVLLPSLSPLPTTSKSSPLSNSGLEKLSAPPPLKSFAGPTLNALENPLIGQNTITTVGDLEPFRSAKVSQKATTKKTLNMMQSLVLIGTQGHTQWVSRFSEKPYYQIESDATHQVITLTLDDIDPRSLMPPLELQNSSLQSVDFSYNTESQLVIKLTLKPLIDVQGLRVMGEHPTEFVMDLSAGSLTSAESPSSNSPYAIRNIKTPGPYRPLVKTPSRYDQTENNADDSNNEYSHAMQLLSRNKAHDAQRVLIKILKESPKFEKAYVALAETYLEQNQPRQALSLLLASPLADELNNQNFSDHIDYYTVLAESYRQSGQAQSGAQIYQALLNFGSNNSVWWVGFGLCLDALGQKEAANSAFNKAKNLGNLPPPLTEYLETKS